MDQLMQENESLTEQYNEQGAKLATLEDELAKLREATSDQVVGVELLAKERDGAKAAAAAAVERSQQLAAEVVELEEMLLRMKSENMRREREARTTRGTPQRDDGDDDVSTAPKVDDGSTAPKAGAPPPAPTPAPAEVEEVGEPGPPPLKATAPPAAVIDDEPLAEGADGTTESLYSATRKLPPASRQLAERILSELDEFAEEHERLLRRLGAAQQALELAEASRRAPSSSAPAPPSVASDAARVPLLGGFLTRFLAPPPSSYALERARRRRV